MCFFVVHSLLTLSICSFIRCYSDEHYLPTLLYIRGEGNQTYPVRGPSHVNWRRGGPHPLEYEAEDVSNKLFMYKLRMTVDCIRGERSQETFIRETDEIHFMDAFRAPEGLRTTLEKRCEAKAASGDTDSLDHRERCSLAGRKFKADTAQAILDLMSKDCEIPFSTSPLLNGKLNIIDDRVCESWPEWQARNDRVPDVPAKVPTIVDTFI